MSYCPLCRAEYLGELEKCPDCKVKLVENLEVDSLSEKDKGEPGENNWALIKGILTDLEADIIAGLLETNEIPVLRKYPGMSGLTKVYMGSSFSVDLYVPSTRLQEARELLNQIQKEVRKGD
ncbi:MAG: DUF2007 domain-containing protein [Bacillota bacterium]